MIGPPKVLVLGSPDAKRYAEEMICTGKFRCLSASGIPDADYPGYEYVTLRDALRETCGGEPTAIGCLTPPDIVMLEF